jgi:hypothetical protein
MLCCPVQACRALLIGLECVLFEVVMRYLSITQFWFIPQARSCDRTVLKSGLRWSVTWWRGAAFYHRRPADRWALARGSNRYPIAIPNHTDSLSFVAWISLRANPDDPVVVDRVSIGGHAGPSIGFVIAGCLTTAWNVDTEFFRPWWNSKPMVIVRRSSCSWVGRSRSLFFPTVNDSVPHVRLKLFVVDPLHPEFTKMNLSASSLPDAHLSTSRHQIFGVWSEGT